MMRRPPRSTLFPYPTLFRSSRNGTAASPDRTTLPGGRLSAPASTRPTAPARRPAVPDAGLPANALGKEKGALEQVTLYAFVVVPFLALAAVVPAVWGWGLSWLDVGLAVGFYSLTLLGITVGYHRHFTHGSFKAARPLRIALAVVGCMAIQGPVVQRVAEHRRHPAFSDREGAPHSPWRYGTDARALLKGMWHAPLGWLFDRRQTSAERYAPDLLKDTGLRRTSRDRKSTRLNSSHANISYAVFCLKKKTHDAPYVATNTDHFQLSHRVPTTYLTITPHTPPPPSESIPLAIAHTMSITHHTTIYVNT